MKSEWVEIPEWPRDEAKVEFEDDLYPYRGVYRRHEFYDCENTLVHASRIKRWRYVEEKELPSTEDRMFELRDQIGELSSELIGKINSAIAISLLNIPVKRTHWKPLDPDNLPGRNVLVRNSKWREVRTASYGELRVADGMAHLNTLIVDEYCEIPE